ncbi:MAG: CPBP family intramembrane metalloprotease [Verrucomicrobia bacterium]|nr:CPBP family intramembrane metalloprotease [Verrucomicrobiota bacterium]
MLVPAFRNWPFLWIVPLLGYSALVAIVPPLRATFRPWSFGRVSTFTVAATFGVSVVSCAALVAFHSLAHPDVSGFGRFLAMPALGVLAIGVLFSLFNGLFEELIFRGILFDAVESQWGIGAAIAVTALVFGYGHMHGYPPGALGAVLAGIYGVCLGWLRATSRGLGLPIIAHIAADATIFTIVARSGAL